MCSEAISIFCPPCDCPTKMLCIFVGALFGGSKGGLSKSREQSLSHFVTAPFTQGSLWRRAGMTTLPSCLRQATVSRGGDRALVAAKPVCPPLRSSRLDRSACVSSSHASAAHLRGSPIMPRAMGHFQVRKWSKPHLVAARRFGLRRASFAASRQGGLVCGALRLPHDLICLPLLFPQNSLRDFCGSPEKQESTCSPLTEFILRSKRNS